MPLSLIVRAIGIAAVTAIPALAAAQAPPDSVTSPADVPLTMFPHDSDRWWLSGQLNVITQGHGTFPSPYSGPNSLVASRESATSRLWTIDTGLRLTRNIDFWFDLESAGGGGISEALGLAGFTNLDVVRNPSLGAAPYVARAMIHVTFPFGPSTVAGSRRPWSFGQPASHRLEIRFGKMSLADAFDANSVGSDSHLQFTNWTVDNNGAYDYAADTRGYTYAAIVEYDTPQWAIRGAEALMPTVANGIHLDGNITRARADNVEFEWRPVTNWTLRLLAYENHANMGRYADAIQAYLDGETARPDIESTRRQGRVKTGAGFNTEYAVGIVRLFGRAGVNEGQNESFAYTEVNNTIVAGGDLDGVWWHRHADRIGIAVVSNGLSAEHRQYLALGGLGFLLGDGALTYGREQIVEGYYTAHLWRGLFSSLGVQRIGHPGFNRDRGPVTVGTARVHVDF